MNWNMIILPLAAAALGYFTNLLAVTMLFRPHREIRIFGKMRLPFTPGLIPKEQKNLARKIGESIQKNVLTDEVLETMLTNPEMMSKLEIFIKDWENRIFNCEQNIGELIGETRLAWFTDFAAKQLTSGLETLNSDTRKISDVLPPLKDSLNGIINNNTAKIAPLIENLLNRPTVDNFLRELISKIAKEHIGGIVGLFINVDKIYDSIRAGLLDYITNPENCRIIADTLIEY
ncbi:MAG: DUF445 family protein, partial [Defluviitaleaceae bacterium]|nr:DUF445 family protein [Defluviitaleaceae bacterium]